MQVTVKLFGSLREAVGAKELAVRLDELGPPATVGALRALLARDHPEVGRLGPRLRASRNLEIVPDEEPLAEGDEVAFLPPVAGGSEDAPAGGSEDAPAGGSESAPAGGSESAPAGGSESVPVGDREDAPAAAGPAARCTLSDRPLDPAEVTARVAGPDAGGLVTFAGAVRDHARGHAIEHLEYEAYAPLAVREMEAIADEAAARWPGARVALAHRVGHLAIGDLAVVVVAAAPHRAEAFDAARFAIDTLKERVPIWKKEVATDGAYWVDDHA